MKNQRKPIKNIKQEINDYQMIKLENAKLRSLIIEKDNHISNLDNIIFGIKSSFSYRCTLPIRAFTNILKNTIVLLKFGIKHPNLFHYLKKYGFFNFVKKIIKFIFADFFNRQISNNDSKRTYEDWIKKYEQTVLKDDINDLKIQPLISIILPVYKPPIRFLKQAIDSVINQSYKNFELCIIDDFSDDKGIASLLNKYEIYDKRIKLKINKGNLHISEASNEGIKISSGEYITFLDHDDLLPKNALFEVVKSINENPKAKVFYSDEDKIDKNNNRFQPYFKPDWNYDLLLSQNTFCHMTIYTSELVKSLKGFNVGFEGSQDYDLALRAIEKVKDKEIVHISKILYHWRAIEGSTAFKHDEKNYCMEAGKKALENHFQRRNEKVKVEILPTSCFRNYHSFPLKLPLVSIVIPTKNNHEVLGVLIESILKKTDYKNYEIIIINNQSNNPQSLKYFSKISKNKKIKVINYDKNFNFSAMHNFAIKHIKGDYMCMLNNDTEVISTNWLSEMMSHSLRKGIGIVGAKLLYTNGKVQHAGVILGIGGVAGHIHKRFNKDDWGYMNRARLTQNFSAVTGACLLIKKDIYIKVKGMNEELPIEFNDIDLCLRVLKKGYRILWTPFAILYHHESFSRGLNDSLEKIKAHNLAAETMKSIWGKTLENDPAYNKNFSLKREDYSLK